MDHSEPSETTAPTGCEPNYATSSLQRLRPPFSDPARQSPSLPPLEQSGLPPTNLHEASSDEQRPFTGQSLPETPSERSEYAHQNALPPSFVPREYRTLFSRPQTSVSDSDALNHALNTMSRRMDQMELLLRTRTDEFHQRENELRQRAHNAHLLLSSLELWSHKKPQVTNDLAISKRFR